MKVSVRSRRVIWSSPGDQHDRSRGLPEQVNVDHSANDLPGLSDRIDSERRVRRDSISSVTGSVALPGGLFLLAFRRRFDCCGDLRAIALGVL